MCNCVVIIIADMMSASGTEISHVSEESKKTIEKEKPAYLLIPTPHLTGTTITTVMNEVIDANVDDSESTDSDAEDRLVTYETLDPLENMPPLRPGTSQKEITSTTAVQVVQPVVEEKMSCQYQHPLVISSVYVLKALRNFVNNYYKPKLGLPTMEQRLSRQRNTICRLVEESDIKMFWEQFKNIFTEENDNIWNALSEGLTKYHAILKDRKFLHDEVVDLRQQNQDLKILLAKYMDNPDNPNLEPPCAMQRSSPPGTRARKL